VRLNPDRILASGLLVSTDLRPLPEHSQLAWMLALWLRVLLHRPLLRHCPICYSFRGWPVALIAAYALGCRRTYTFEAQARKGVT